MCRVGASAAGHQVVVVVSAMGKTTDGLVDPTVGAAMREAHQDETRATLAGQAIGWVKPLVALAGGIINGGKEADIETIMASR